MSDLRAERYDYIVIDAQGLVKSAIISRLAKGLSCGLDFASARETLAALLYQRRHAVAFQQHAVVRARKLFAAVLNYTLPADVANYAIRNHFAAQTQTYTDKRQLLFFHWNNMEPKKWPENYWKALANYCVNAGWKIALPWGNSEEKQRAENIAQVSSSIEVLPKLSLHELALLSLQSRAAVAVDTGLGHLAAALSVPTLSLYGPTDPQQIGACGEEQYHLRPAFSQSMQDLSPEQVWEELQKILC